MRPPIDKPGRVCTIIPVPTETVARKLFHFCLVWALLLGCWGGVLAAVACPHADCRAAAAPPARDDAHDASHAAPADAETQEPAGHAEHPAPAPAGHCHAGEPAAAAGPRAAAEDEDSRGFVFARRGASCVHCEGAPRAPASTKSGAPPSPAPKVEQDAAPQVVRQLLAPARAFVREVIPAQHAPPGPKDRRLLLSVFLI